MYESTGAGETVRCSFCGKTQEEVKKLLRVRSLHFVMSVSTFVKRL